MPRVGAFRSREAPATKLEKIPFQTLDWTHIPETKHPAETGHATWRTREVGNVRVRMVTYSAGYLADYVVADGDGAHRSRTRADGGATLFIVD